MCDKHYRNVKNKVNNKHALQALPGKSWIGGIGKIHADIQDMNVDCSYYWGKYYEQP